MLRHEEDCSKTTSSHQGASNNHFTNSRTFYWSRCARLRFFSSRDRCSSVFWFRFCIGESAPQGGENQIHLGRVSSSRARSALAPFAVVRSNSVPVRVSVSPATFGDNFAGELTVRRTANFCEIRSIVSNCIGLGLMGRPGQRVGGDQSADELTCDAGSILTPTVRYSRIAA